MPQPVDLQSEIAKVSAAERVQAIADRLSLAAQQRLQEQEQEDRLRAETEVVETDAPQNEGLDPEGKRRNPFVKVRKPRQAVGHEQESSPPEAPHDILQEGTDGHLHIDVKI